MKRPSLLLSLALLALPSVASARAYEAPDAYCHDLAEAAYQAAVARGDGLPDGAYSQTQSDCDAAAYRWHLLTDPSVRLNDLIAFDQESDTSEF
jgi:hypothetical protein